MKAKLAVLKSLDNSPAGAVLIGAWHQLTVFCHQHAYQMSPTVAEVHAQCRAVQRDYLQRHHAIEVSDTLVGTDW